MSRLLLIAALLVACGGAPPSSEIGRAQLGDAWPLTVESGTLACDRDAVTFRAPNGTVYAVNGLATSRQLGQDIDAIWAANPEPLIPKMDISPLVAAGLALCQ